MSLWRSFMGLVVLPAVLGGCDGTADGNVDDTAVVVEDDTGGGGTGTIWRASGAGTAYFLDGALDNSLFHLELTRCTPPREGEAYFGWVSNAGADRIALGEIVVDGEEVIFEADIGANAIIRGYDTFEAWATTNGGTAPEGEQLWVGQVDPVIYGVIQTLLIASDATPDGEGSLRSVEASVQTIREEAQGFIDRTFDLARSQDGAEGVSNALYGTEDDRNDDGTVSVMEGQIGVLNDAGYIEIIKADLAVAAEQVDPSNPIRDYINYAYDCTKAIGGHAEDAAIDADIGSICMDEGSCDGRFQNVLDGLGFALDGADLNEDGVIDDFSEPAEGTIECAISFVSQMAQMTVDTP